MKELLQKQLFDFCNEFAVKINDLSFGSYNSDNGKWNNEDHKAQLLRVSKKLGYNKTCSCDNCFYGRTRLAEELLNLTSRRRQIRSTKFD